MVGLDQRKLYGRELSGFIVEQDRSSFHGRFRSFFRHPEGKELSFRIQGTEDEIAVRCAGRVETDTDAQKKDDAYRRLMLMLSDVTARKQTEEALRESEERFSLAMQATRD